VPASRQDPVELPDILPAQPGLTDGDPDDHIISIYGIRPFKKGRQRLTVLGTDHPPRDYADVCSGVQLAFEELIQCFFRPESLE
jgi:hypothetical protein